MLNNKIKIGNYVWKAIASSNYFPYSLENYFMTFKVFYIFFYSI